MNLQPKYRIYPSLLDKFNDYLNIDVAIEQPWNASKLPAEVEREVEESLLNSINRVPFESEAAEKGTAFNDLVDKIIAGTAELTSIVVPKRGGGQQEVTSVSHTARSGQQYTFDFPTPIVREFVEYFRGAAGQVFVTGILQTRYGPVELYGYVDELIEDVVYDIKTTSQYDWGKYSKGWQRHVYPFCLTQMGCQISAFEFSVTDFRNTYREWYTYLPEQSEQQLRAHCERFIEFLESRRNKITDKKIFNEL